MARATGQVYFYDRKKQEGIIVSRDMRQFNFSIKDYTDNSELTEGNLLEFEADGQSAHNIRLLTGAAI